MDTLSPVLLPCPSSPFVLTTVAVVFLLCSISLIGALSFPPQSSPSSLLAASECRSFSSSSSSLASARRCVWEPRYRHGRAGI
ncbi:hypothetical protein K1719_020847 [Acacia pycnantha]|nr:hypothetical protein K1719_020847 [Acacia pycnantha]